MASDRSAASPESLRASAPGPTTIRWDARKADLEALRLLNAIRPMNRKLAAEYIRAVSPNAEALAGLAFLAIELSASRARRVARMESILTYAWQTSTEPERERPRILAETFGFSKKHVRTVANRLGLRKERT